MENVSWAQITLLGLGIARAGPGSFFGERALQSERCHSTRAVETLSLTPFSFIWRITNKGQDMTQQNDSTALDF
jgi:hypothetical protein